MAAKSAEQSRKTNQNITVWLSENEETDDESECFRTFIHEFVGRNSHSKETNKPTPLPHWRRSESEETDDESDCCRNFTHEFAGRKSRSKETYKLTSLPRWKRSESVADLKKLKSEIRKELNLYGGVYESETEDYESETKDYLETNSWTHNFKTFTGEPLPFTGTAGPTISSNDPFTIFTSIWDKKIMSLIVEETNRYAKQTAKLQVNQEMPKNHVSFEWQDTTVEEMYIMFALLIFASYRGTEAYIFGKRSLVPPVFSEIMSLERFLALNRFLHFVDNEKLAETDKMLAKMKPVLDHCNERFASLYRPRQFLDVDDSFLLSKQGTERSLRLQANYFGVRTYELSEVYTGYVLKILQYPGPDYKLTSKDKAQIVLDLVREYSNKGHRVVTNNQFSSIYLARTLRSKGFDNIGDIRKSRKDLPEIIQKLEKDENDSKLYQLNGNKIRLVSRHCGDVSVVAWSEWDMTTLSTYHSSEMRANKRGIRRPALTLDVYKGKEKISDKDEDLSDYIMIRQPSERWYIRQFKSLLNISLRNMYVLHKYNTRDNPSLSQVSFRNKLANQLLDYFGVRELVENARVMSFADTHDGESDVSDASLDSDDSIDCCIM
ncbi:unnamed protein product [Arctia plantaginis]|uniref:PiggyBac transposable element-derived protein domain-containing protein n=1 Tax=Arctia plantaginis TaxID=874455 RepID=A0A8S1BIH6_ARCPL|nr:unnamed protein product [Arctia plantaginis]